MAPEPEQQAEVAAPAGMTQEEFTALQQNAFLDENNPAAKEFRQKKLAELNAARKAVRERGLKFDSNKPKTDPDNRLVNTARLDLNVLVGPKRAASIVGRAQFRYLDAQSAAYQKALDDAGPGISEKRRRDIHQSKGLHRAQTGRDEIRLVGIEASRFSSRQQKIPGQPDHITRRVNSFTGTYAYRIKLSDLQEADLKEINKSLDEPIQYTIDPHTGRPTYVEGQEYEFLEYMFTQPIQNIPHAKIVHEPGHVDNSSWREVKESVRVNMGPMQNQDENDLISQGLQNPAVMDQPMKSRAYLKTLGEGAQVPTLRQVWESGQLDKSIGGTPLRTLVSREIASRQGFHNAGAGTSQGFNNEFAFSRKDLSNKLLKAAGENTYYHVKKGTQVKISDYDKAQVNVDRQGNVTSLNPNFSEAEAQMIQYSFRAETKEQKQARRQMNNESAVAAKAAREAKAAEAATPNTP